MKSWMICVVLALMSLGCTNNKSEVEKNKPTTPIIPQRHWSVHTEKDSSGNIIRYDSMFVSGYSVINGKQQTLKLDSMMNEINRNHRDWGLMSNIHDPLNDSFQSKMLWSPMSNSHDPFFSSHFDQVFKRVDSMMSHHMIESRHWSSQKGQNVQ